MDHLKKQALSFLLIFSLFVGIAGVVNVDTAYAASKYIKSTTYRNTLKSGKKTILAKNTGPEFAIKGKKIYYNYAKETRNGIKYLKRVMMLNGKSKKATKYKAKMTAKLTNARGYLVDSDTEIYDWPEYDYIDYYLQTPDGDIFLESYYPVV